MEKELVDIILNKSFIDLTSQEKLALIEWCKSEEEFEQLKLVFQEVKRMNSKQSKISTRPETKESLDDLFAKKKQTNTFSSNNAILRNFHSTESPFYKNNLVRIAAVLLILFIAYPFFKTNNLKINKEFISKNESPKQNDLHEIKEDEKVENSKVNKMNVKAQPIFTSSTNLIAKVELQENSIQENDKDEEIALDKNDFSDSQPASAVFNHSDGIYVDKNINSVSLSSNSDILDLLTVAF